jgi:opacity protein-like surface antigen
MTSADLI